MNRFYEKKEKEVTIEQVRTMYEDMYSKARHDLIKIQLKAWLYHAESRHKNGNPPFTFSNYTHAAGIHPYVDYIRFGLIDCEDIGGKEAAEQLVKNYYK